MHVDFSGRMFLSGILIYEPISRMNNIKLYLSMHVGYLKQEKQSEQTKFSLFIYGRRI